MNLRSKWFQPIVVWCLISLCLTLKYDHKKLRETKEMRNQTWLKSSWPKIHFILQQQHCILTQLQSHTLRLLLLGGKFNVESRICHWKKLDGFFYLSNSPVQITVMENNQRWFATKLQGTLLQVTDGTAVG